MRLSIIVPVYNVEDYVLQCLESLKLITNFDYEILIINDGSIDKSLDIINEFISSNTQLKITLINQENHGLSYSRNIGLKKAKGEFVFFIDSDDWICTDTFVKLINNIDDRNDIIVGNYLYAKEQEYFENSGRNNISQEITDSGINFLTNLYIDRITSAVWRSVYKREFLLKNNLYFLEGVYFEDVEWGPKVYYLAKSVKVFPKSFYYYRVREGSIMNSEYNEKRFNDSIIIAKQLYKYSLVINNKKSKKVINKIIVHLLLKCFVLYNDSLKENKLLELKNAIKTIQIYNLKFLIFKNGINLFPKILKNRLKVSFYK